MQVQNVLLSRVSHRGWGLYGWPAMLPWCGSKLVRTCTAQNTQAYSIAI